MDDDALAFYASPGAMTELPDHPALAWIPVSLEGIRDAVQGLLVHRDWAAAYGIAPDEVRLDEQNLRSVADVLDRAFDLSAEPVTVPRAPIDRVLCICRHFTLLHTALLRSRGLPARVRCGFSNYFDAAKWYDHWITERWADGRWVRDDPQIDDLQAAAVHLDFDPYDQPPGKFLTGSEAWIAARNGEVDPMLFGIFDMWGLPFISGNVISDLACINKVELLPWDGWGMMTGPFDAVGDEQATVLDELAALVVADDFATVRARYLSDDRLRVPAEITTIIGGELRPVVLDL